MRVQSQNGAALSSAYRLDGSFHRDDMLFWASRTCCAFGNGQTCIRKELQIRMFGPRGIHGQFIYPATVWLVGEKALFRSLREMRVNQWLTAEELERRQSKALRALLRQAIQHCPWYQARPEFRAVEAAEDPIAHLNLLPTISKTTIRTQPSLLMAAPLPSRTTTKVTGGSTGEAVTILKNREQPPRSGPRCGSATVGSGWRSATGGSILGGPVRH